MQPEASSDSLAALSDILPVSRETGQRLAAFVGLVRKWQKAENLIGPATLPAIWRRHVADSAQLLALFSEDRRWLDLGSGGGFPGIVLACFLAETSNAAVHLVEANMRKCAFLRRCIRDLGIPAEIHQGRIEAVLADWTVSVDRVTARALAPLGRLLALAEPLIRQGIPAAFFKGADFALEIETATQSWDLDLVKHPSRIDSRGVILEIRNARRRDV
ncbi:16S rRNA (guanine(527)-N(7))-methyltransferase RsmG [Bauldia sp.]|uniref:16S rRNA (guanine(527)-N(7))-methyltransferase RsmG n=1 Tax=Bauldia sp. TaxID=2575872 RepID=UPI003BA8BE87